jgi:hypothetical protein
MLDGFAKFTLARLVGHLWLGEGGEGWGFGKGERRGTEMKKWKERREVWERKLYILAEHRE